MLTKPTGPRYDGANLMAAMNLDLFYPPCHFGTESLKCKNPFTGSFRPTSLPDQVLSFTTFVRLVTITSQSSVTR